MGLLQTIQAHPVESAAIGALILDRLIARGVKWTDNAKRPAGKKLHEFMVKLSDKRTAKK